jgi:1,4-alpha-glucan branching enzyme
MAKKQVKRKRVTFALAGIEADTVCLMGDFNLWNEKKHPMKSRGNGAWEKIVVLPPGRYEYKFLVDGSWCNDPVNNDCCDNEFGTQNNVIHISRN